MCFFKLDNVIKKKGKNIENSKELYLLVIGKNSNLSQQIFNSIKNCILFSSYELVKNIGLMSKYKGKKVIVLFNNFQKSSKLNNIDSMQDYISRSILSTSMILDYLKTFQHVEKILYTSSSSVYGNNEFCSEEDLVKPINLHASLKLSNEYLIKTFCKEMNIDYTILRIFNMYGGNDNFSIVSKIINSYKEKEILPLINEGTGIRDFIHIDDVVYIILKLLKLKNIPLLNLGTGEKKSILKIISFLTKSGFTVNTKNIINDFEIKISISNPKKVLNIMDKNFINVEDFILSELIEHEKAQN